MVGVRALQGGFPRALLRHYREEQGSGTRLGLLLLPGGGGEPVHLHQVMLLPHSPLLRIILEGREEEQVALVLPGTDPATLQLLVCLLYGGRSPAVTPAAHTALEDLCSSLGLGHWLQDGVVAEEVEGEAEKNEEKAEEQWLQEWVRDGRRTKAKKASAKRHFVPPSATLSTLKSVAPSTLKSGGMTDCDTMPPPAGTPPPPGGEELDSTVVSTFSEFLAKRELVAAGEVEGSGGEEEEVLRLRAEEEEERKCNTEEVERAVWSVEYEEVGVTKEELRAGRLVLASHGDWGWWPALVDHDPRTGRLAKVERGVRKVRVVFVEENSTKAWDWAWVAEEKLRKFTGREVGEDDYEERQEAFSRARAMVGLGEEERLELFWEELGRKTKDKKSKSKVIKNAKKSETKTKKMKSRTKKSRLAGKNRVGEEGSSQAWCACRREGFLCGASCGCPPACSNSPPAPGTRVGRSEVAGNGCFATRAFARGELVGELTGRVRRREEATQENERRTLAYIAELNGDFSELVVDGEGPLGSPLTRANHGQGWRANGKFVHKFIKVEGGTRASKALFVEATKKIRAGEEVLVAYGPNYKTRNFK